eukprot:TRINITY_DN4206_c0_g1_i1.p1 TRINITY_DN4206_c0_g1~~TRINITY_DN4206_c0_g1_i1.p1  ORF type:complete len:159 (-),score=39.73 TRINITY_DN4206_c0_g1_i1:72-488(-)
MKMVREFAVHWKYSDKRAEMLIKFQRERRPVGFNPLVAILDVVTRWWLTYQMLSRLITLKPFLVAMKLENLCERFLTEKQWRFVELTRDVLEPFMLVQRLLEGEKYVTSSVVAFAIFALKHYLEEAIAKYGGGGETNG